MPHVAFDLSHDLVEEMAHHRPTAATMWGLHQHDHQWDDLSPEGTEAWRAFLADARARIQALPPPSTAGDRLAVDVAQAWVDQELEELDSGRIYRLIGHVATPIQGLHLTLTHMDRRTPEGKEAVRARLAGLPEALEGYKAGLVHGLDIGERAAVRQVRSCVKQGQNIVARRLLHVIDGPEADAATLGYAALTDWLETTYLPRAAPADGVGEARYLPAAKAFLHDELDLDATYAWGWQAVAELYEQLVDVLSRVRPGATVATAVEGFRSGDDSTSPSPDAFLDQVRTWQADALERLDGVLPVPPIARQLLIERAPKGLPPGAWYMPPSEDGSRPGKVQYSLRDGPVPIFDQQSTACHEGFPGHHLQLAIQSTLHGRLSRLHRLAFRCVGFAEGWALYAERLVDEHDGYDNELQRAGFLVNQLARACRVVLDIGLHTARPIPTELGLPQHSLTGAETGLTPGATWTYARGVAFLTEIGGLRREVSESEVTRYLGWPGQAISYSVGMRRLLELRADFLAAGGELPDFHERVLGSGMVGLSQVARTVME